MTANTSNPGARTPPMNGPLKRSFRDMEAVAAQYMAHLDGKMTKLDVKHVAFLLLALQIMSQVLTRLLRGSHPFWTDARDHSLDTAKLLAEPPRDLLRDAAKAVDAAFWNAADVTEWYWPLHLRLLLSGSRASGMASATKTKHAGALLAFRLRVNVVPKLARRLLAVLTAAMKEYPTLAAYGVLQTLVVRLHWLLRQPQPRTTDDADLDPHSFLAREYHQHHFAGDPGAMSKRTVTKMNSVLTRIGRDMGPYFQNTIAVAALQAGITNSARFFGSPDAAATAVAPVPSPSPPEDELSVISTLGGGVVDTQRFLLTQMRMLKELSCVLLRLRDAVEEDAIFHKLVRANPSLYFDGFVHK